MEIFFSAPTPIPFHAIALLY